MRKYNPNRKIWIGYTGKRNGQWYINRFFTVEDAMPRYEFLSYCGCKPTWLMV